MGAIVVLVDHDTSRIRPSTLELLTAARQVGREQAWPVHAVWVGPGHDDAAAQLLAAHGAAVQDVVAVDGADPQLTASSADAVLSVLGDLQARLLLVPNTFEHKEVAARVAVATGGGVVVNATSVRVEDGHVVAGKPVLAGSWQTSCAVPDALAVVALAAHSLQAAPASDPHEVVVHRRSVEASAAARAVQVVSRVTRPTGDRPSLAEAEVVVVGGRGTEGDFAAVEDLADALGGAVGATRVATDEGWVPHELQVGQTGVTISPRLYIGAGVSGAVHHRGGMDASQTVVAINSDPDAPIFEFADYGVVGDLSTILPALAAEIRNRRAQTV